MLWWHVPLLGWQDGFNSPSSCSPHHGAPRARRAAPSGGAVVVNLADGLEALPRHLEGFVDDLLGQGEACGDLGGGPVAVDLFRVAIGGGAGSYGVGSCPVGRRGGYRGRLGAVADVVEDAAEEVGVGRDLAGAEEG